ncbi:twin-arginine translocation signal domain-containing protein [bacterium]|nr:twin-arginine translocation signal domain-containing protein [bacterium]
MTTRRRFIRACALAGAAVSSGHPDTAAREAGGTAGGERHEGPILLSTWDFGQAANATAWPALAAGGAALDAVEAGARQAEADPDNRTVGLGGLPDRDGHVTLDACIMDHQGRAGSVCFLEGILHPVSVARRVMEATPHVMLAGQGARRFALAEGFASADLLTDEARREWEEWRRTAEYRPRANRERHDTLSILARDRDGRLAGACTTSGMSYKMHGRIGDSPIIGAALYVDGAVGAACATGHGEFVMRTLGSFLVVELMRQGRSAQTACEEAVDRIARGLGADPAEVQVGYLAMSATGEVGGHAVQPGFQRALRTARIDTVDDVPSRFTTR